LGGTDKQRRETLWIGSLVCLAHYCPGGILKRDGRLDKAIPEFQKSVELNNDAYSIAMLGPAFARNGQRDEAQKIIARVTDEAKSRYVAPYASAVLYLGLGDKERALAELERAYQTGDNNYLFVLKVDPMTDGRRLRLVATFWRRQSG